ncbi:hypothetical protein CALCODRAFT_488922 [Calocera cornea HHB12733]|uniref:Protein kinase domain-containing protein n=1 Tax=Calocera cornea HHB12733 TaxID=1353952 RepID=A0A165C2F5_9BASI|nr:hypothetical protein CALCODRAFT_488922 [Calocera cornea HHB12733]
MSVTKVRIVFLSRQEGSILPPGMGIAAWVVPIGDQNDTVGRPGTAHRREHVIVEKIKELLDPQFLVYDITASTHFTYTVFLLRGPAKYMGTVLAQVAAVIFAYHDPATIADFGFARPGHSKLAPDRINPIKNRYTNCLVTRWYRPPELRLGESNYGFAIDMWGGWDLGLCSTPTEENMSGRGALPGCEGVKHFGRARSGGSNMSLSSMEDTVDRLDKVLLLDPHRRITAAQAIDHEWFRTDPLPADPKTLSPYESSHEYDKCKAQMEEEKRWNMSQSVQASKPTGLSQPLPPMSQVRPPPNNRFAQSYSDV